MNNQDKQQLLEKAERDYYSGIAFKRPSILSDELDECFRHEICVSTGDWEASDNQDGNGLFIHNSETCCYFAGQWAEIVSKPEQKTKTILLAGNPVILKATGLQDKETPQPLDIEKDQRYLDLLDEEAKKKFAATLKRNFNSYKEFIDNTIPLYKISFEKVAQRKYFELLLSEKDKEIERISNLNEMHYNLSIGLEKSFHEHRATISQQAKEIERYIDDYKLLQSMCDSRTELLSNAEDQIEQLKQELKANG